ncbi:MAG TPA: nucleotide exchange factor GrpE [Chthoniobacterales bacterium]
MSEPSEDFKTKEHAEICDNTEKQDEKFVTNPGTTDPEAGSPEPNKAGDAFADPESRVAELQTELSKYKDAALRATADLDNYRKRVSRERDESIKFANTAFLERLIPILDNFELGLQAARNATEAAPIVDGLAMVYKQLQDLLTNSGVETIDATGQTFDPNLHEALAQEENHKIPEGKVIRQVRKGYRLRDRLLRPANVVVSKGTAQQVAAGGEGE